MNNKFIFAFLFSVSINSYANDEYAYFSSLTPERNAECSVTIGLHIESFYNSQGLKAPKNYSQIKEAYQHTLFRQLGVNKGLELFRTVLVDLNAKHPFTREDPYALEKFSKRRALECITLADSAN